MIGLALQLALLLQGVPAAGVDECTVASDTSSPAGEYSAIVTQYRLRQFRDAGERLRALPKGKLDRAFVYFRTNAWPDSGVLAALWLHTEVGMASILQEDPQRYFDAAWKLTDLVRDGSERKRIQRQWLLVMGLFYQRLMFDPGVFGQGRTEVLSLGSELFRGAQNYFDDAVKAFPRDPEILVAAGTLFEWSGAPNFGEPRHLAKAEDLYERATRADANDAIAQLRYGNTLWKRGRSGEATAPLRRVLELSEDSELLCRAHMALGRIAMLENKHEEATSHFREALELEPEWQVVSVALSHALHMTGARDESSRVLERGLEGWSDEHMFGWWSYETGLTPRFGPLLEEMRAEVLP